MKKISKLIIIIVLAAVCLSGCGKTVSAQKYSAEFYDTFDTVVSITAYCKDDAEFKALSSEIHSLLQYFHRLYDIYNEYDGMVNARTLNENAGRGEVEATPELLEILEFSKEMHKKTDGCVNIAMGSVLKLWHEAREASLADPQNAYIPSDAELAEAAKHCNIDDLVIKRYSADGTNAGAAASGNTEKLYAGTVRFADPEMTIDLGAVAKGFAVEKIAQNLEAEGKTSILISAGGNVRTIGTKPGNEKWSVAVQNPVEGSSESYADILKLENSSLVTSGVNQRYYEYNGAHYHHIIDCDTLHPENRYLSVSILTRDSALADALSTAVFNMEPEEGVAFVNSLEGVEALWILPDGTSRFSDGYEAFR